MIEEGFSEQHLVRAVLSGSATILEDYTRENRCLIVGYYAVGVDTESPLHVVCDYRREELLDFVTAYIPRPPWWITPTRRGRLV